MYHPYSHSPSALTEYFKAKLHTQRAKRLSHSLPARVEQNVPLERNMSWLNITIIEVLNDFLSIPHHFPIFSTFSCFISYIPECCTTISYDSFLSFLSRDHHRSFSVKKKVRKSWKKWLSFLQRVIEPWAQPVWWFGQQHHGDCNQDRWNWDGRDYNGGRSNVCEILQFQLGSQRQWLTLGSRHIGKKVHTTCDTQSWVKGTICGCNV